MNHSDVGWLENDGQDAVRFFWQSAGYVEEFPRTLERPLALALPVVLVRLPSLHLRDAENWLRARGSRFTFSCQSRAVRGCLVAYMDYGIIFVDGTDPDDERRVTIAHEIAHFLMDYWLPRRRAEARFGPEILQAIDGQRAFSASERIFSIFEADIPRLHTELLDRETGDDINQTWKIENRADKVAMALLAPPEMVLAQADLTGADYPARLSSLAQLLRTSYGLPDSVASAYAAELLHASGKGRSWVESLRLTFR